MIKNQFIPAAGPAAPAAVLKRAGILIAVAVSALAALPAHAQEAIAPPAIGQETKGTPAVIESPVTPAPQSEVAVPAKNKAAVNRVFGTTKITESRRESGQLYLIELEHSSGAKQYIEETDSDGKIESTSNDIEETPNLPKWKIGSW